VRAWPTALSLGLGLVPVSMFAAMVAMLVSKALPALSEPGLGELFSSSFSSQYSTGVALYGLLPAMWGTLLVTVVAISIALPVSLAMAVFSSEFQFGGLGRAMRTVLGALSGIPAIVYALLAIVFVERFMIPKFAGGYTFDHFDPAGVGANPETWPPPDVPWNAGAFPWDPTGLNNSTLLGGALIALLVIPFMAPLIDDAFRNVPAAAKEASLALGANRWHTLLHVTLPMALAGIVPAVALGTLKGMGDTMIVIFVVGWEAQAVPDPPVDVLERTAPLPAVGANLLGGFQAQDACSAAACSAGYFSAVFLLILALTVVVTASFLQARLRRKLAP
jgi:phosphate transport system permease protein